MEGGTTIGIGEESFGDGGEKSWWAVLYKLVVLWGEVNWGNCWSCIWCDGENGNCWGGEISEIGCCCCCCCWEFVGEGIAPIPVDELIISSFGEIIDDKLGWDDWKIISLLFTFWPDSEGAKR